MTAGAKWHFFEKRSNAWELPRVMKKAHINKRVTTQQRQKTITHASFCLLQLSWVGRISIIVHIYQEAIINVGWKSPGKSINDLEIGDF